MNVNGGRLLVKFVSHFASVPPQKSASDSEYISCIFIAWFSFFQRLLEVEVHVMLGPGQQESVVEDLLQRADGLASKAEMQRTGSKTVASALRGMAEAQGEGLTELRKLSANDVKGSQESRREFATSYVQWLCPNPAAHAQCVNSFAHSSSALQHDA